MTTIEVSATPDQIVSNRELSNIFRDSRILLRLDEFLEILNNGRRKMNQIEPGSEQAHTLEAYLDTLAGTNTIIKKEGLKYSRN